jgi:prepilin-type N-terminal cleavage/methylation domain-containing protein
MTKWMSKRHNGFTIVELMVTVAVIGILIRLVVPMFFTEGRKGKARSEVSSMFAEIATKEQQYRLDQPSYLGNNTYCPSAPSAKGQSMLSCIATGGEWSLLRIELPETEMFCAYLINAGDAGTTPAIPAPFSTVAPDVHGMSWYYIIAKCDMDSDATGNSEYFTASWDTRIRSSNEGQ